MNFGKHRGSDIYPLDGPRKAAMSIQRGTLPIDSFTIVSNAWLRDSALSWKAKGLLAYIASHAPGHRLTTDQILAEGTDGKDAVRAGLVELERRGYLRRIQLRGEGGKITGTDYELTEPEREASAGKPVPGADLQEQDVSAGHDQSGLSGAGKPAGKKTTSQKTKNTPSASPRGTRCPEDFMPSEAIKNWCSRELPAALFAKAGDELVKFRNYWTSKTGRDATKLDWNKTFQNWMINARDRYGVTPVSGPPASKPFVQQADDYKARKTEAEKAHGQMVDALMDDGLPFAEALARADEAKRAYLAQEPVASSSDVAYIEGVILSEDPKEVTGS